ncbi:phosphoribosylformylglycinamidine synthase subunit PurL [Prochlorococcus sp. MIT 1307]|uniref:phosphoribosylformylglycinamidine synthase subunit PurL n=1 Tax=Prochlorococcus sp. MIT 1307 TaxID=3096219 RepID=UPI002A75FD92|nr:phosphoribosylformylglycinamidine synthase subunit PurL [Prochlorococcus sp. MIT 1307]
MSINFSDINFQKLIESPLFKVSYDVSLAIEEEGLEKEDYIEICRRLNRPPNRTELGMFGVMWSEHCCYRNSRSLLKNFPIKGSRILVGPGENAGVVDIGEGQQLAFKIESHNHPSALEPFQGAATGVGGILRDIFTMGARPIALLNSLRFGPIDDEHNISLMEGVVAGIAHYGNCVGVPTIGGEVSFDTSYSGNPLVNAMALGLMETEKIVCSGADGIDYPVMYVGSTTGRDGMGGASFASAELTKSSLDDRPAVQVGDPFLEKGLIEACLQAFKSGYVVAAQDMGAAGLTCSCSEMAAKGGLGIELNLDLVPAREKGMTAYEFLLSESQERMLFVVKPDCQNELKDCFTRWGLHVSVVGKVLKENIVRVLHKGSVVAELPANALADDTPINYHDLLEEPPLYIQEHWNWNEKDLPQFSKVGINLDKRLNQKLTWNEVILKLLDYPTISSKRWVYRQYDYQVQSNTVLSPGISDAAIIRIRPQDGNKSLESSKRGIAAVVDCPNRWVSLDPERGAVAAVVEAARNISCVGAEPLAITNNLNFASPDTSIGYWQLALACEGITKACQILETPVTGGNVSLYNETRLANGKLQPIHPTPVIGMVGLVNDLDLICGQGWKHPGDSIWLLGLPLEINNILDPRITLGASSYLEVIHELSTGRPPEIDLELEKVTQAFLRKAIIDGYILSAHDVSDGGIAVAIAECCMTSDLGAYCYLPNSKVRLDRLLFAEGGARIIVSIDSNKENAWKTFVSEVNKKDSVLLSATKIGTVQLESELLITQSEHELIRLSLKGLRDSFESAIPRRVNSKKEIFS